MITKNIDQISEEDLQALIDNSMIEHKSIEYKQSLSIDSDFDKKEFLKDVSSFANASGGDLIYGIIEDRETGIPRKLEGLPIMNVDQEISRLENLIRDGIEPRILGIIIKPIALSNSKKALIIRIPKSWISPHRVKLGGHNKFYSRNTNGKYELDVAELRIAFNFSETITERIRKFREDRVSKIYTNETPVPFYENAKIILHLIPIISFNPAQRYDIKRIATSSEKIKPIYYEWNYYRYNLDGFLTCSRDEENNAKSYVQLFNNGIIETVIELLKTKDNKLLIPITFYENELIKSFKGYLSVLKILGVEPPIFIFLTLLGVKGYSLNCGRIEPPNDKGHKIDRDVLILPENIIESYNVQAEEILKPLFDAIWNACGYPKSLNYDEAGNWIGR